MTWNTFTVFLQRKSRIKIKFAYMAVGKKTGISYMNKIKYVEKFIDLSR